MEGWNARMNGMPRRFSTVGSGRAVEATIYQPGFNRD
jgi:hypothetical protein